MDVEGSVPRAWNKCSGNRTPSEPWSCGKAKRLKDSLLGLHLAGLRGDDGVEVPVHGHRLAKVDEAREDGTFVLPAGQYLTTRYRGPYEQNGRILIDLIAYAERNGLDLCGKPLEFYEIDNRDTADETEFVTRIEVQVST